MSLGLKYLNQYRNALVLLVADNTSLRLAQQKTEAIPSNTPKFFKQPDLDKFYGTWIYERDGKSFSITLKKDIFKGTENSSVELLGGTHTLKQNGKIVDERGSTDILNSINSGSFVRPSKNLIKFRFMEYRRRVFGTGSMEYIDGPNPTILWKLDLPESRSMVTFPGEENKKNLEYIVPTIAILYKVK